MAQHCLRWREAGDLAQIPQDWTECNPYQASALVKFCINKRETQLRTHQVRRSTHAATAEYLAGSYQHRSLTKVSMRALPVQSPGISLVLQCRVGALLFGPDLVRIGRLDPAYATSCLFCGSNQAEDLQHLLFDCAKWQHLRVAHIRPYALELERLERHWPVGAQAGNGELVDSVGTHNQGRLWTYWLLGGEPLGLGMRKWAVDLPLAPDEDDSLSDTSSAGGDATGANEEVQLRLGKYETTCAQVGFYLYSVCCLWAQILRALPVNSDTALSTTEDQSLATG